MQNTPVIIPLGTTETITIMPAQTVTLSSCTIERFVDFQGLSTVRAFIKELPGIPLILWSPTTSPTYAEAGNYTQSDIENRVIAILSGMSS